VNAFGYIYRTQNTLARRVVACKITKARNALLRAAPSLKTAEMILAQTQGT
jgi:hypothetical protein